jgi:hypothetical protein
VVVFKEAEDAECLYIYASDWAIDFERHADLRVMGILNSFIKCGGSQVMLLPRSGYSVVEGGCRGGPDVLVGFSEGGRLHGDIV